ncbi:MAG: hypothetical protein K9L17_14215 [Clostridiales bacterium]|nr:hypothetical protein [Clostridiales bacterium]MCF8023824.1 hypothetical protein [Clostridiales bacterium]
MKNKALGIVGTAKNSGKTTTTMCLIDYLYDKGICVGLTSIGYDGERMDNITGLPKPRLYVRKGVYVATAEKCLEVSTASIKVIETLDTETSLGKIVCGRVEQEGLLVLAGPNQSNHLRKVKNYLYNLGVEIALIDGALNRIAPMVEADGFILATGASYKQDCAELAMDAFYMNRICNITDQALPPEEFQQTVIWDAGGRILGQTGASLFTSGQLDDLKDQANNAKGFYCPGLVMSPCLDTILHMPFPEGIKYYFSDPVKLIVGNDLQQIHNLFEKVLARKGKIYFQKNLNLLAITINPFYPCYDFKLKTYEAAYVDREQLRNCVTKKVNLPVIDTAMDNNNTLIFLQDFLND